MEDNLFRGQLVRLCALSGDDAPTLAAWSDQAATLRRLDTHLARPRSVATLAAELERQQDAADTLLFGLRRLSDDLLIGWLNFSEIEWPNRGAWLALAIGDPQHWGQNYGRDALDLALRYAFQELNLHRLTLTVIADNRRAIALYERAGFVREGLLREFGERDGRRYDLLLYGLLEHEWRARQGAPEGDQP